MILAIKIHTYIFELWVVNPMWKRHDHSSDYFREKGITVFQCLICSKVTNLKVYICSFFSFSKRILKEWQWNSNRVITWKMWYPYLCINLSSAFAQSEGPLYIVVDRSSVWEHYACFYKEVKEINPISYLQRKWNIWDNDNLFTVMHVLCQYCMSHIQLCHN